MKRTIAAMTLAAVTLTGCGVEPPKEGDSRFTDLVINGVRCIVFKPGDTAQGTVMQCNFGNVPVTQAPINAGPTAPETPTTEGTPTP